MIGKLRRSPVYQHGPQRTTTVAFGRSDMGYASHSNLADTATSHAAALNQVVLSVRGAALVTYRDPSDSFVGQCVFCRDEVDRLHDSLYSAPQIDCRTPRFPVPAPIFWL